MKFLKKMSESVSEESAMVELYLASLTEPEKKAIEIAKRFFQSGYCVTESNGFLKFKRTYLQDKAVIAKKED